jgi:hypothetical protein
MAGAGYKLFATGDVLTAAQVNTYLNEQTVMVFADSAARTSALSGVLAEGMMSYLQDTNSVEVYNGTAWVGVGNVGDITEVQAGVGISIASGTGPIPVITNSSTDLITTAGDILYGTAADTVARLGIGTAGQVLKVNSGATAPEWGAAASGGSFTQITPTSTANSGGTVSTTGGAVTASAVNSVSLNGIFSATYEDYVIVVDNITGNTTDDFALRFRAGGTDNTGATNYKYAILFGTDSGVAGSAGSAGQAYAFVFEVTNVADASLGAVINVWNPFSAGSTSFASTHRRTAGTGVNTGRTVATGSFDGITFTDALLGREFSGTIRVYGYSK